MPGTSSKAHSCSLTQTSQKLKVHSIYSGVMESTLIMWCLELDFMGDLLLWQTLHVVSRGVAFLVAEVPATVRENLEFCLMLVGFPPLCLPTVTTLRLGCLPLRTSYIEIKSRRNTLGVEKEVYIAEAGVNYLVYGINQWISYDNKKSLGAKRDFANKRCLGGVMIWAIGTIYNL